MLKLNEKGIFRNRTLARGTEFYPGINYSTVCSGLSIQLKSLLLVCMILHFDNLAAAETDAIPGYDIQLNFHADKKKATGKITAQIPPEAIKDGLIYFDISYRIEDGVTIEQVKSTSGFDLEYRILDGKKLEIQIGEQEEALVIHYSFPTDESLTKPYGYYVFENFSASKNGAYPVILQSDDLPYRFANYNVKFEYPASLTVLTTGGLGKQTQEKNRKTATYEALHAPGFAIVAGNGFETFCDCNEDIPIIAFFEPEYKEQFLTIIERTKEAASWYLKTYGFFPLKQVGIIQGHPEWGGGYPLPNMFAVHLGNLQKDHITWITAHELGHYYWGYTVTSVKGSYDWLQLSLGIWADQLYLAERKGISIPDQWRSDIGQGAAFRDYFKAVISNYNQQIGLGKEEVDALDFDYNSLIRHSKSAIAIYLQSLIIGPKKFLELQKYILKNYYHKPFVESDLVAALEAFELKDAASFYQAWTKDGATIDLAVTAITENKAEKNGWDIKLERIGQVPYPVEVTAIFDDGTTSKHIVKAASKTDQFTVNFKPEAVLIDPRGLIPMRTSSNQEMQLLYILALEQSGLYESFIHLGAELLEDLPDSEYLRYRLVRQHYWLAKWNQAIEYWQPNRKITSRYGTLAAMYRVRSLARLGRQSEAGLELTNLKKFADKYESTNFWRTINDEITQTQ